MIRRLFKFYEKLSNWPRIFLNTLAISIPFYFAAFLSSSVAEAYQATIKFNLLIHVSIFGVLITFIAFFYRILLFYYKAYANESIIEHNALFSAFTLCDRRIIQSHKIIKMAFTDPQNKLGDLIASIDRIQDIIDDAYLTFEAVYGNQDKSGERIDFEVTFMTKSYDDEKITIPCSANRSGRKPRSMILRKDNRNIYEDTETAKLYSLKRPDPIIIPDTSSPEYAEIYHRQKDRIKSSIIYPVLCEDNILLGTLVVHCDRPLFFNIEKHKFWFDLLEIFAKRISIEKNKLDLLYKFTKSSTVQVNLSCTPIT